MIKKELRTTIRIVGLSRIVYENVKKNKSFNPGKFFRDCLIEKFGTSESKKKYLSKMMQEEEKKIKESEEKMSKIAKEMRKLK